MNLHRLAALCGVGALALAPLSSTACRTATQIDVTLETSAGVCEAGATPSGDKRTGIFVSAAGDTASAAESARLEGCAARLGSVTLVPSGKDGDPLVEVAMSLTKGDPAGCRSNPAACIVARRRLGFQENRRLSLTIRLDGRCIGVPCGRDQTCDDGVCRDATVTCSGDQCALETSPPVDAGAGGDGGDGAAADAGLDAGAPKCPIEGQPVTHSAFAGVTGLAGTGSRLYLPRPNALTEIDEAGKAVHYPLVGAPIDEIAAVETTVVLRRGGKVDRVLPPPLVTAALPAGARFAAQSERGLVVTSPGGLIHDFGAGPVQFTAIPGTVTLLASGPGFVFAAVDNAGGAEPSLAVATGDTKFQDAPLSAPANRIVAWRASPPRAVFHSDGAIRLATSAPPAAMAFDLIHTLESAQLPALAIAGDDVLWTESTTLGGTGTVSFKLLAARLPPQGKLPPVRVVAALPQAAALDPALAVGALGRCAYVRTGGAVYAYPIPD